MLYIYNVGFDLIQDKVLLLVRHTMSSTVDHQEGLCAILIRLNELIHTLPENSIDVFHCHVGECLDALFWDSKAQSYLSCFDCILISSR